MDQRMDRFFHMASRDFHVLELLATELLPQVQS